MTPLGYVSDRLKVLLHERIALLEEHTKKGEQFICLDEERKVMIEIEMKARQEAQDLLMASQLDNQFKNVHIGGGNNSSPSTPPKTPRGGRHSRTSSQSPSPRGRRASRHDYYRRPTPPRVSRKPSQQAHHGSQYGGGSSNFDYNAYDFLAM